MSNTMDDEEFPLDVVNSTHEKTHKYMQHDASPNLGDPDSTVDPDTAWADAMTPEEYVMSSENAMQSAIIQEKLVPRHSEGGFDE